MHGHEYLANFGAHLTRQEEEVTRLTEREEQLTKSISDLQALLKTYDTTNPLSAMISNMVTSLQGIAVGVHKDLNRNRLAVAGILALKQAEAN